MRAASQRAANNHWRALAESIQSAFNREDLRTMYRGVKQATGPSEKLCYAIKAPNGTLLEKKEAQLSRWVEHFHALYSRNTVVDPEVIDGVNSTRTKESALIVTTTGESPY